MEILRDGTAHRVHHDQHWIRRMQCGSCHQSLEIRAYHLYFLAPPSAGYVLVDVAYTCPCCDFENKVEFEPDEIIPILINWNKQLWRERTARCCQCAGLVPKLVTTVSTPVEERIYACRNCGTVFRAGPQDAQPPTTALDFDSVGHGTILNCPSCHETVNHF